MWVRCVMINIDLLSTKNAMSSIRNRIHKFVDAIRDSSTCSLRSSSLEISFHCYMYFDLSLALLLAGRRASPTFAYEATNIDFFVRVVLVHVFNIEVGEVLVVLFVG